MPADPKAELLRQIRTIRSRLDPDVLAKAEEVARRMQPGARPPAPPPEMEPYDKETARQAVMLFLQSRSDNGLLAARIMEAMKQPGQAAQAYEKGAGLTKGRR